MRVLAVLSSLIRPRRPEHGPVPQLLPEWRERKGRALGPGVVLRRLGGVRVLTARGALPRLRGIEAVRGFCLLPWSVGQIELLIDGRRVRVAQAVALNGDGPRRRRKQVFNIWHDFGDVPPGVHRLTVRPRGWTGRLTARNRRVVIEAPPAPADAPDSDAFIPGAPRAGTTPDAIVASLPSVVRDARRSPLPDPVRSILVLRADQLGDLAISVPALRRLRALFPVARIAGLVTPANADLARALGLFDRLIVADYPEVAGRRVMSLDEQERLRSIFAAQGFDLAIDLGEGAQSRLVLLLSGARFLYGFRHGDHPWLSAAFELNARDPADGMEVISPARKLLAMVESLGAMGAAAPAPPFVPRDADRLARYDIGPADRYVILHMGARLRCSRWPGFAPLAELLLARTDLKLIVFTHSDPGEVPASATPAQAERLHVIDRLLPFEDFDALLSGCALLVGNDSGPKHLAALRGTKVVSLHMARLNWQEWGQEGEGLIVSRRIPCAGCNIGDQPDECGRDFACIRDITPDEVFAAAMRLL